MMSEAILGGSPCDRDGFRERFLAEHQGIIDDVNTLKSNCEDAVKESEEFAKDGVSLKAECSGRDVNVRALTKRIRVFQGMKDAVEKCDWASDVATQIQKEGNAGAVQASLRYIFENAPEVDDKARNTMKLDWDALDDLKQSNAETPEQFKAEAQDAAARFGGQRSVAELQAMGSTHADKSSSSSVSNAEEEDELLRDALYRLDYRRHCVLLHSDDGPLGRVCNLGPDADFRHNRSVRVAGWD